MVQVTTKTKINDLDINAILFLAETLEEPLLNELLTAAALPYKTHQIAKNTISQILINAANLTSEMAENDGYILHTRDHRKITSKAKGLQAAIKGRPIPEIAKTRPFQNGLSALAELPASTIRGQNRRGKVVQRLFIAKLAKQVLMSFPEANVIHFVRTVLFKVESTPDSSFTDLDSISRAVQRELTTGTLTTIRQECEQRRQQENTAELNTMRALAVLSTPPKPVTSSLSEDQAIQSIMDAINALADTPLRISIESAVLSELSAFGLILPKRQ